MSEKFNEKKILDAINRVMGDTYKCPVCGYVITTLIPGYDFVNVTNKQGQSHGPGFTSAGMICLKCGHLLHFNLDILLDKDNRNKLEKEKNHKQDESEKAMEKEGILE